MTFEAFVWYMALVLIFAMRFNLGLACSASDDTDDESEVQSTKFNDDIWGICLIHGTCIEVCDALQPWLVL